MKKIFYFIASAIVALGAVACQNEGLDNIAPEANGDIVSFVANIDNTKTDLSGMNTVWTAGDAIMVTWNDNTYEFKNSKADVNKFTCQAVGLSAIVDAEEITATYSENNDGMIDSTAGLEGALLSFEGSFAELESEGFQVQNAFLKFTAEAGVVITATEGLFSEGTSFTVTENGDYYVAVNEVENAIIANGGEKCAKITTEAKKIYNLGTLALPIASENWGVVGAHQGWNTENKTPLYLIPETNTYVARNVTLADGGFKFVSTYTTTKIIEHPAVTTGEKGDWYLQPNSNWKKDGARFAIYFFGNGETWVSMKDENGDGIYVANNPTDGKNYPSMIFCRMNPSATANNWNNKWNQTSDLTKPTNGNNCYAVKEGTWDKGGGTWSVHTPEVKDAWTEEVEEITNHWVGVKSAEFKQGEWFTAYSNNLDGSAPDNITVADYNKTYDLYLHKGEDQDWGFTIDVTVVEFGGAAPELK